MNSKLAKYTVIAFLATILAGCGEEPVSLKVGSKDFAESRILAEMIAQLAENEGIVVERNIPFGPTNKTLEGLKQGILDIYPDYNGTSLVFLGQAPISDSAESTRTVNELFKPQGFEMGGNFGFSNDYVLAMTPERAQELDVEKISDLAGLSETITFAVDDDFLQRPADGLQQMNRRYGITGSDEVVFPVGSEGKDQQILALLDRSADVAELYATDGQIAEYGLVVLEDDQAFFPVYDAAPLLRSDALETIPALSSVLDKLTGAITPEDMQAMNKAVDLDAQAPASVATAFLVEKGLLPESVGGDEVEKLIVAADPSVGRSSTTAQALRAIRTGFEGRDLELTNSAAPLEALSDGSARVAMVGAESFYTLDEDGPVAKTGAEAFAVLGYKTAHLIGLRNSTGSITEMSRISTGVEGSGSSNVLDMILASLGLSGSIEVIRSDSSPEDQVAGLINGDYDGVFTMARLGDREVTQSLVNAAVGLVSLDEWAQGGHTAKFSFIRPATIGARTYSGQYQAVSSVSTQYVLAGPVEQVLSVGVVGPGTAGTTEDSGVVPVGSEAVNSIREAIGDSDIIDPTLPIHSALIPKIEVIDRSLPFEIDISIVNILAILFTVWAIYLCFLPSPRTFTLPEDDA